MRAGSSSSSTANRPEQQQQSEPVLESQCPCSGVQQLCELFDTFVACLYLHVSSTHSVVERIPSWVCAVSLQLQRGSPCHSCVCVLLKVLPQVVCVTCRHLWSCALPVG